jgi:hypothetical protein
MEGYFVRTLGMHRVYNSAFMNMLRDEQNANYRSVIKNTIEFDPEILKRYVNFMSNPDERTAVDQFGRGDKYFGVCTLMSTLPGLPMFGHGQVEGYEERYGMEYRRAYRDEQPDGELVGRHEREIFPLLHRRAVFAEAREFRLYDFFGEDGHVNEDVFAYSNRRGDERGLIVYHNKWARAAGWIRLSSAYAVASGAGKRLERRTLGEALGLSMDEGAFCRFRDFAHGFEYLRRSRELCEQGFYVDLGAYQRHVFLDMREVRDSADHPWALLAAELAGRGVESLDEALDEIRRRPLAVPFRELLNGESVVALAAKETDAATLRRALDELEARVREFLAAAADRGVARGDAGALARRVRERIAEWREHAGKPASDGTAPPWNAPRTWMLLAAYATLRSLAEPGAARATNPALLVDLAREWRLDRAARAALAARGLDPGAAHDATEQALALLVHAGAFEDAVRRRLPPERVFSGWLADPALRRLLGVHTYDGVEWLAQEAFESWLALITGATAGAAPATQDAPARGPASQKKPAPRGAAPPAPPSRDTWLATLAEHARRSGWRTERLLAPAQEAAGGSSPTGASSARP